MKQIKTSSPPRLAALLFGAALFGLVSQSALALTASGTSIGNLATLSYTVGGTAQTNIGSSSLGNTSGAGAATTFVVDLKVNVLVSNVALITLSPAVVSRYSAFTVTNLGNARQNFGLVASNASLNVVGATVTDSGYDVTPLIIIPDDGAGGGVACDGIVNGTEAATTIATLENVAADSSKCVFVRADFTLANTSGQIAVITLKASTRWPTTLVAAESPTAPIATVANAAVTPALYPTVANTAGVDVVFADAAGVLVDAGATPAVTVDNASDGTGSAYGAFRIASAALSVAKTVKIICDPINGNSFPKNIPGAILQYAITISNSGATAATLTTVTDTLQANALDWDTTLNSGAGAASTCVNGNVANQLSAFGFGAVYGTGTTTTTYTAAGASAAQALTAGAAVTSTIASGRLVTITYANLAGGTGIGAFAGSSGLLPANSFITVYFNAVVQ